MRMLLPRPPPSTHRPIHGGDKAVTSYRGTDQDLTLEMPGMYGHETGSPRGIQAEMVVQLYNTAADNDLQQLRW
jgi:hypothetical protein